MSQNSSKINLYEINRIRKKELNRFFFVFFLGFFLLTAIFLLNNIYFQNLYVYIGIGVGSIVFFKYLSSIVSEFKNSFEYLVYETYKQELNFKYHPNLYLSESEVYTAPFFDENYDDYSGSDLIVCDKFRCSYLKITKEVETKDDEGNVSTYTKIIFEGYFYIINTDFSAKHPILITENSFHLSDILPIFTDKERVKLDYPAFEKIYDVYCDDKIEANMYLNHNRMNEILKNMDWLKYFKKFFLFGKNLYTYNNLGNVSSKISFFREITEKEIEIVLLPVYFGNRLYEIFK